MKEIKVFAPASIANLSCGYDILGVCLDNIGDEITVRKTKKKKELRLKKFQDKNLVQIYPLMSQEFQQQHF